MFVSASEYVEKQDIEEPRQRHRSRQRQDPGRGDVADRRELEPRPVGRHSSGDTRRQDMSGRYGQAVHIGRGDRAGGDEFGGRALTGGQMRLTDLSPTVTTMRFHPIIVPSAIATATLTQ